MVARPPISPTTSTALADLPKPAAKAPPGPPPHPDAGGIAAIAAADHGDPFGFLGMHTRDNPPGLAVRTFQPRASAVAVVDTATGTVKAAERVHDHGMFVAEYPGRKDRFPYRLRITIGDETHDCDDPYRFPGLIGELDQYLLAEGTHLKSYEKLGAFPVTVDGISGVRFAVWAPNARRVSVIGDFNAWDGRCNPMRLHPGCGVWEIFIPGLAAGALYKFEIRGRGGNLMPEKGDPYAFSCETPPRTASVVQSTDRPAWTDEAWMGHRAGSTQRDKPITIYEVHLESWRRRPEEGDRYLTYTELADELVAYAKDMGFTHIELLPVSEYPFGGSWGYQPSALYAPTSRFGAPDDFQVFVDRCHQAGVGLILDWVVGHFPEDPHGLVYFDGTHLYEHADPRRGRHADWGTLIYNYGRNEVANYLISNALFWLDRYHVDGLRVDAVASMLYLDYSRREGEWLANQYGGKENIEAIFFLRRLNELIYSHFPGAMSVAEESTAWPMVSRPTYVGGLGFGYKWNMGWMHDTLRYMSREPVHRKFHHNDLTFGMLYAWSENFILPLSHDEVVHGKGSLLQRMPGDRWQKFANLRLYFTFMWTYPGKKLLFMGGEFGQEWEWNHNASLDWHLLGDELHKGVQSTVRDLNWLYRNSKALHERDCESDGFSWIDCHDHEQSVISYLRRATNPDDFMVVVCNFTPVVREGYRIGVPRGGWYVERFNSDSTFYGGSNKGNGSGVMAEPIPAHGFEYSISLLLPPLGGFVMQPADHG